MRDRDSVRGVLLLQPLDRPRPVRDRKIGLGNLEVKLTLVGN